MNEEIVIEAGTIEDFIYVVTSSYEDFFNHNPVFKIYETIFTKMLLINGSFA